MSGSSTTISTAVPGPSFTSAGFVAPAESDILAGALSDMNAALGGNANLDLSTPQGQLAMSLTAIVGNAYDQMLALFNGVDPARSTGIMQDAIGELYGLIRNGATATVVTVTCTGTASATIPAGTLIQDKSGNYYAAEGAITLDATGTGTGSFSCQTLGAIECPANSVSVYQSVSGLASVNNPAAGVTGSNEEDAKAFEVRRNATLEKNAMGFNGAIRGVLLATSGVTDAYVTDNSTSAAVTSGGVTLAANSLYVCVNGGTDDDVAQAILSKKPPGCAYTGTTSVTVQDTNAGYTTAPSYKVSFTRATATPVYIAVTLKTSTSVPSTVASEIQAAVLAAFNSDSIDTTIGSTLYASSFVCSVAAIGTWVKIISITIGTSASPTGTDVSFDIDQIPTLDTSNVTVTLQ